MTISNELKELYEAHGGDMARVAHALGLSDFQPTPVAPPRRREQPADLGRVELRRFKISARHINSAVWPADDEAKIEKARSDYEAGTHEMCQGRDPRGWFVLYSIPRKKRVGARKFFVVEG